MHGELGEEKLKVWHVMLWPERSLLFRTGIKSTPRGEVIVALEKPRQKICAPDSE